MGKEKTISHLGIIVEKNQHHIKVKIENHSACSACHAKGACSTADLKEKIIEVPTTEQYNYTVGQKVNVICNEELGFLALFWAYILPLILVILSLFIGATLFDDERIYGILSVLILIPYYTVLWCYKSKLKKQFLFRIEKIK